MGAALLHPLGSTQEGLASPSGALSSSDICLLPLRPVPAALLRGRQLLMAAGRRPLPPRAAGAHRAL